MFGIFSSGGFPGPGLSPSPSQDLARALAQSQRQPQHQAAQAAYLGPGGISSLQALREASQRPWNPSAPMMGGTITTGQHDSVSINRCIFTGGSQPFQAVLGIVHAWNPVCVGSRFVPICQP